MADYGLSNDELDYLIADAENEIRRLMAYRAVDRASGQLARIAADLSVLQEARRKPCYSPLPSDARFGPAAINWTLVGGDA